MRNSIVRLLTLPRLTARLIVIGLFAALLYSPSLGWAATAPPLGAAESFAVLGGSTVTNTGATIVTGDLGVSTPGVACTSFAGCTTTGLGKVIGTIYVNPAAGPENSAQLDAQTAYDNLLTLNPVCTLTFAPTDVLGTNYPSLAGPGVFCFSSSAQLTGKLTLTGSGPWIFIIGSTLTTATNSSVVMSGSGNDTDVYWAIGSSATLGTGTAFTGNILAVASITLTTGASVSGRALARAAVTMDTNNVASTCSEPCNHPLPVPPRPIDVTQLVIDHYLCYQAKPEDKVQQHQVVLEDQFGKRTVTLKRPETICTPVVKDADPKNPPVGKFPDDLRYPSDHLACYQIEGGGKDEGSDFGNDGKDDKHGNGHDRLEVLMENQFGKTTFTVKKPRFLCVPSLKTLLK